MWWMPFLNFICVFHISPLLLPRLTSQHRVLGANSQSKKVEFQSALQFAQEYAILAASIDDRPFIPVSSVIVGGAPREFKVLFRNWEDAKIPTSWQPSRKPSLRLVGLTAAMEAMKAIG